MTFQEWWDRNYSTLPVEFADRTFAEEVWDAAQEEVLKRLGRKDTE